MLIMYTLSTSIYTLSLHDALPISEEPDLDRAVGELRIHAADDEAARARQLVLDLGDRKSTRLNSSHRTISYAVFCLKKKKAAISTQACSSPSLTPRLISTR